MMPANQSSLSDAERRRLEYERKELKRVLNLLRAQLVTDEYVDDMMNASEIMAIRQELYAEFDRLRQIGSKFAKAETRIWSDDELKELFSAF